MIISPNLKVYIFPSAFLLVAVIAALIIAPIIKTHKSPLMTERGFVFEKQFDDEINESSTGVGMSTGGHMVVTTSSTHVDKKYLIFFKCEHGVIFFVDRKDLWENLNRGDSVSISYHEVLDRNNEFKDFDFVDAKKMSP